MAFETNKLVGKVGRIAVPACAAAGLVLAAGMLVHHNGVHAAMISPAAPMDDNSVSSLVALDNAVEAVAARVTPAVVNVAVTSHGRPSMRWARARMTGRIRVRARFRRGVPPGFSPVLRADGARGCRDPQQPQIEHGIGSGIIISPDGYIVTNNHVVDGASQMRVTLNDRRVLNAKVVGVDKLNDLAVIKIRREQSAHDRVGRLDEA